MELDVNIPDMKKLNTVMEVIEKLGTDPKYSLKAKIDYLSSNFRKIKNVLETKIDDKKIVAYKYSGSKVVLDTMTESQILNEIQKMMDRLEYDLALKNAFYLARFHKSCHHVTKDALKILKYLLYLFNEVDLYVKSLRFDQKEMFVEAKERARIEKIDPEMFRDTLLEPKEKKQEVTDEYEMEGISEEPESESQA